MENNLLVLFFFLPFMGAFLIPVLDLVSRHIKPFVPVVINFILLVLSLVFIAYEQGTSTYFPGGWSPAEGVAIGIHLSCDGLSRLMLLIINLMAFVCAVFSVPYLKKYTGSKYFHTLFCLQLAGLNGVVLSADMFNIFVFMEVTAKASYALVAFGVRKTEIEASFKYQIMGGLASLLILMAIVLLYWMTSTLNMADISHILRDNHPARQAMLRFIQLFLIAGLSIKAAMIPFHAWLPDAHSSAPSPVSAMLSGVVIKVVGIYVVMRLFFNVFEPDVFVSQVLVVLGGISMTAGVFLAIGAWNIKRLLAYHSISQMGYVVMGMGLALGVVASGKTTAAVAMTLTGAIFHMFNHAVFKGLLFLSAGSIEYATGTLDLKKMGGLARYMPITLACSFIASMAIAGVPPFNGFFSKFSIVMAAIEGGYFFRAGLGAVVGIITLASFAKFQRYAFLGKTSLVTPVNDPPLLMRLPMIMLAVVCLAMSLLIVPEIRSVFLDPAVHALLPTLTDTIIPAVP